MKNHYILLACWIVLGQFFTEELQADYGCTPWHARSVRECPSPSSATDWTGWESSGCSYCGQHNLNYVNFGYATGKGVDSPRNYAFGKLMLLPTYRSEFLIPFFNLDGYYFKSDKWAGSIGTGLRFRPTATCCFVGVNAFYDALNGTYDTYTQFGLGFEYLSKTWEARLNCYLPIDRKNGFRTLVRYDDYIGPYTVSCQGIEQPLLGADFEVGHNFYYCNTARFYIGAGPAWYESNYSGANEWVFAARSYLQLYRYFTFEVRTFKEENDPWHVQGRFSLTIPFDCVPNFYTCSFSDIISQPVYRNDVIKRSRGCCLNANF